MIVLCKKIPHGELVEVLRQYAVEQLKDERPDWFANIDAMTVHTEVKRDEGGVVVEMTIEPAPRRRKAGVA